MLSIVDTSERLFSFVLSVYKDSAWLVYAPNRLLSRVEELNVTQTVPPLHSFHSIRHQCYLELEEMYLMHIDCIDTIGEAYAKSL